MIRVVVLALVSAMLAMAVAVSPAAADPQPESQTVPQLSVPPIGELPTGGADLGEAAPGNVLPAAITAHIPLAPQRLRVATTKSSKRNASTAPANRVLASVNVHSYRCVWSMYWLMYPHPSLLLGGNRIYKVVGWNWHAGYQRYDLYDPPFTDCGASSRYLASWYMSSDGCTWWLWYGGVWSSMRDCSWPGPNGY